MNSAATTSPVRSMTGQGHAERRDEELGTVVVEIRTVNHRGFKCTSRTGEPLSWLDSRIEQLARSLIRRGAVQLIVNWQRPAGQGMPTLDRDALQAYYGELQQVREAVGETGDIDLTSLLGLPGVVVPPRENWRDDESLWEFVRQTVLDAVTNLNAMRSAEGASMTRTLIDECQVIEGRLEQVLRLAPRTVDRYRTRLQAKIERALSDHNLEVPPVELLREVQIYADRADISEEITRLSSHLEMFQGVLQGEHGAGGEPDPAGRKLDFIIQEMFRETNTIGSKSADAEISSHVVEIKCAIERMRELVQNLE